MKLELALIRKASEETSGHYEQSRVSSHRQSFLPLWAELRPLPHAGPERMQQLLQRQFAIDKRPQSAKIPLVHRRVDGSSEIVNRIRCQAEKPGSYPVFFGKGRRQPMQRSNDFTTGGILSPLLRFMIPVFFAMLLQAMYGAVDLLIVGKFAEFWTSLQFPRDPRS